MKTILTILVIVAAPFVGFTTAQAIDKAQFKQPAREVSYGGVEWPKTPPKTLPLAALKK